MPESMKYRGHDPHDGVLYVLIDWVAGHSDTQRRWGRRCPGCIAGVVCVWNKDMKAGGWVRRSRKGGFHSESVIILTSFNVPFRLDEENAFSQY